MAIPVRKRLDWNEMVNLPLNPPAETCGRILINSDRLEKLRNGPRAALRGKEASEIACRIDGNDPNSPTRNYKAYTHRLFEKFEVRMLNRFSFLPRTNLIS